MPAVDVSCGRGHGDIVNLSGHHHEPGCGHERVLHNGHYDYVGDDGTLHHLLEHADCCEHHATASDGHRPVVVSHGRFSKLLHHIKSHTLLTPPSPGLLDAKYGPRCSGPGCTLPCCTGGAPLLYSDQEAIVTKIFCEGVCCPMEIPVVEACLGRIPGVVSVEVAVVTKTITARHVPSLASPAVMVAALNEARLGASLTFPREQTMGGRSWIPPWYVVVSAILLIISCVHYLSGPTHTPWLEYFKWISLVPVALCLPGIALKAFGALRHFVMDIHLLITLAAAGAIAIGDYSEAAIVVVLFCISDFLEERCTGQARDAISAVLALKPDVAVLASTGKEIPAAEVLPGTLILIRAGDKAPLDGVIVSGTSAFDESILTGESVAVVKHLGDTVCAGTLNAGSGLVEVRTTAPADETFVAGMARLVEQATSRQSPAEAAVARFAKIYTPLVLLACILLAFVPWSNPDADRRWWVYLALQVLVTACPCALVLSTPVTVVSALARAAQVGVLVKGGVVLETLRDVQVMTLDKTGTLTVGAFMVEAVTVSPWTSEAEVLRLLGSLERGSSHPLAAAIVGRAAARGITCDGDVKASAIVPGFGIRGTVEGRDVRAGTSDFLRQLFTEELCNDAETELLDNDAAKCENRGVTTCFVALDGKYAGCITASDALRPEASTAVRELKELGITPAMLTGDNPSVAFAIGAAAGIEPDHIHAALLPQDKLDLVSTYNLGYLWNGAPSRLRGCMEAVMSCRIRKKKNERVRVAHVGDGVNDAPALAAADVGIAMGVAGAAAALEAGDVALFTNDLRVLPALQRLARAAGRKIAFNIALSVVTKIIVLGLAASGHFTLFGAVLVDVGTALLVTLNGLTLLRWDFGLGNAPAACVGAAAAAATGGAHGKSCGDGCCSSSACCAPPKKGVELSSSCCAKGSCGGAEKSEKLASSMACCQEGAEEAKDDDCCGHKHNHNHKHNHVHKHTHEDVHSQSQSHADGHSCGHNHSHESNDHDHSHDHCSDGHAHSHGHQHDHGSHEKSSGGCCSGKGDGHAHAHSHHNDHDHDHQEQAHTHGGTTSTAEKKGCCGGGHTHGGTTSTAEKKGCCGGGHTHGGTTSTAEKKGCCGGGHTHGEHEHGHSEHDHEEKKGSGGCCSGHHNHKHDHGEHDDHSHSPHLPLIKISK